MRSRACAMTLRLLSAWWARWWWALTGRKALEPAGFMPIDCARCGTPRSVSACFCCPDWCEPCWDDYREFSRTGAGIFGRSVSEFAQLPVDMDARLAR
jgi:hypothetical protein